MNMYIRLDHLSESRLQKILHVIALPNELALYIAISLSNHAVRIFYNISQRKGFFIIPMQRRLNSSSNFPLSTSSLPFHRFSFPIRVSFPRSLTRHIKPPTELSFEKFCQSWLRLGIANAGRKGYAIRKFNSSLSTGVTSPDS